MYCLDTSVIIDLFRGNDEIKGRIESTSPDEIFITTITLCELFKGTFGRGEKQIQFVDQFLKNYSIIPLDETSARIFGTDFNELEKSGKKTQEPDLMIASISKSNNLTLVTRNKKHFENIPNLKIEEW